MGYGNLSAEVQSALANLNSEDSAYQPQNAHELFKLEQAVQIFFVTIDGHVSTFSAPETLRIFQFTETSEDSSNVFLQVGGWTQPLVPGHLQRAVRLQCRARPRRRSGVQGGSQPAALPPRAAHRPQDQPAAACRPAAWQGWQLDRLGGGEAGCGHRDGGGEGRGADRVR